MKKAKQEKFICYETYQIKTFHEWRAFYENALFIDKSEYPDFDTWWLDMRKSGVIEMADETVCQGEVNGEKYVILKHGNDDFSIMYDMSDFSLRGNKVDVQENYREHFGKEMSFSTKW